MGVTVQDGSGRVGAQDPAHLKERLYTVIVVHNSRGGQARVGYRPGVPGPLRGGKFTRWFQSALSRGVSDRVPESLPVTAPSCSQYRQSRLGVRQVSPYLNAR